MKKLYVISETNSLDRIDTGDYDWTEITNPSPGELNMVSKRTGLEEDTVRLILGSHESHRISGLADESPLTVIMQYPHVEESDLSSYAEYNTSPIICILTNDNDKNDVITISCDEPDFIKKIQQDTQNLKVTLSSKEDIILLILYYLAKEYNSILAQLSKESVALEKELKTATNNDILYHIMSIQKTVAAFLDSLKDNNEISDKIINDSNYFKKDKYTHLATLASVELEEASELARHLDYLLDKYSNLISSIVQNNSAGTMNKLTKYSLIFGFIGIIFGALGINYYLPEEGVKWMFIPIFIGVGILSYGLGRYIDNMLK